MSNIENSPLEIPVIDNFSLTTKQNKDRHKFYEGECYLKTKADRYKKHWVVIMGNEIYWYKDQNDLTHQIMHCLVGTFVKPMPEERIEDMGGLSLWPIKIILPPNKSRVLYFSNQAD